ncbi:hypothetical protein ACWFRQ_02260 [Streptomyces niveus]
MHNAPTAAHGDDWQQARSAAERGVDAQITAARIERELEEADFQDTGLGPEQEPWLTLLNGGQLPRCAPTAPPAS